MASATKGPRSKSDKTVKKSPASRSPRKSGTKAASKTGLRSASKAGSKAGSMAGAAKRSSTASRPGSRAGVKAGSTRTAARSAKRRSPKSRAPGDDPELIEVERVEFLKAIDAYKRKTGQTFPSWSEVLNVLRSIGWMSPPRLAAREQQTRS